MKDKFEELVKSHGFTNINQFSKYVGIALPNIYSNINGRFDIGIKRMFKMAKVLNCHIDELLEIFYPEEYSENMEIVDRVRDAAMDELSSN